MDVLLYKAIAGDLGHKLTAATVILDFGCGNGETVGQLRTFGFQAYGVDITLDQETEFLRCIPKDSEYYIPFDDSTFDVIVSMSVLEHVKNLSKAVSEMWRVLKPGGCCLHYFPPKFRPIEGHLFVPLGGWLQAYPWLLFWSYLGVRNSFGKTRPYKENAILNYNFLKEKTAYRSKKELRESFSSCFKAVSFVERYQIKHSYGRARFLYPLVRLFPPIASLYSSLHLRVLFCEK